MEMQLIASVPRETRSHHLTAREGEAQVEMRCVRVTDPFYGRRQDVLAELCHHPSLDASLDQKLQVAAMLQHFSGR